MSKKKPTRGGGKRPAADSKVAARKSGRSAGSADSGFVATPAPAVEPAASPLDTLAASLKTADGFYFAPSPPGIGGVRKPSKVESVTIGDGGGGSLLLRLAGGDPKAASAGATEGFSIRVPDPFERQASERTVRVRALARSAGAAPTRVAIAYSTNEVGNSGWQWRDVGPTWAICEMVYKVPKMKDGRGDYIGLLPDNPGAHGVEIHSVSATIV